MQSIELRIDVTAGLQTGAATVIAATLHLPDHPVDEVMHLLVCHHGGSYNRSYWDLHFDGSDDFSFAEYMTRRGNAVVALDTLGMGQSVLGDGPQGLSRALMAKAHHLAACQVAQSLIDGSRGAAASVDMTGVGHSLGGLLVLSQQEAHRTFDRIMLLGWSNLKLPLPEETMSRLYQQCEGRTHMPPQGELIRPLFYGDDVPIEIIEQDEARAGSTPSCLMIDGMTDGLSAMLATSIDVPVFIGLASIDTSCDAHREPAFFTKSDHVTLQILKDAAHCHNVGSRRFVLWRAMEAWTRSVRLPETSQQA